MAERMDRMGFLKKLFLVEDGAKVVKRVRSGEPTLAGAHGVPFTFLRPPGAPLEPAFLAACTRCDLCREACPETIIVQAEEPLMGIGTPIVDPAIAACTQCGLCIEACPDDALLDREDRRMGRAVWHPESCLSVEAISCVRCVEACPEGKRAIEAVSGEGIRIHPEACTGCAFCVHACPTTPNSLHLEGRPPVPLKGHPPAPVHHG